MKYSTSIPAYLWRNALRRWFENPASPATKFLVPFLFGLLAMMIFGLLRGVEAELKEQLGRSDLRSVTISEFISPGQASSRYYSALENPSPWAEYCESSELLLQAPISASSRFFPRLPVLGYINPPSFVQLPETAPGEPRPALILSERDFPKSILAQKDYIEVSEGYRIPAQLASMPKQLDMIYQTQGIALVPVEMLEMALVQAHTRLQILVPRSDLSTKKLETLIRNHAAADDNDLQIFSAQAVLEQLGQISRRQELARALLGFGIAVILSLILGSLSLLEFRQELYLFALLRSFGVHPGNLLLHYLLETTLITFSGGLAALLAAYQFIPLLINRQGDAPQLTVPFSINAVDFSDIAILIVALIAGILLSALPIIFGIRKPAGLLLP